MQLNKGLFALKLLIISSLMFFLVLLSCIEKTIIVTEPLLTDYPKGYVVNGASNNISIIDLNELNVKRIIQMTELGRFPHHISLSADGKKLAVALPEFDFLLGHAALHNATDKKGGIVVLDAHNGDNLLKIEVPSVNFNAVFSADGSEIWTASATHAGEMFVFDANNGTLKNKITLGTDPTEVVFSMDGQYAFVALSGSNIINVLNTKTKLITKTIPVDTYPTNIWAGVDNKIYVENKIAHSINTIDVQSLTIIDDLHVKFTPGQIAYNQTLNELWVCQAGEDKVAYFEKVNSLWSLKGSIITDNDAHAVRFTKDMKRAFVVNQKGNTVSVIDAINHIKTKDISVGGQPNGIVLWE